MVWPDPCSESQIIGRAGEMAFLVNAADDPECRGVVVLGLGGMGKTSLMRIFAGHLARAGRHTTFASLRQSPNTDELFFRLNQLADEQLQQDQPTQQQVPDLTVDNDLQRPYSSRLIHALVIKLNTLREYHIVLDGLDEFSDPPRLVHDILDIIAVTRPNVKFYITSRGAPAAELLGDDARFRVLSLDPLSAAEITQYLRTRFQHQDVSPATIEALAKVSAGSPLVLNLLLDLTQRYDPSTIIKLTAAPPNLENSLRVILDIRYQTVFAHVPDTRRESLKRLFFILSGYDESAIDMALLEDLVGATDIRSLMSSGELVSFLTRHQGRTGEALGIHPIVKDYVREQLAQEFELNAHTLDFGAEEAERDNKLSEGLVPPPILTEIISGKKSIVLGDRGSGKSALVKLLAGSHGMPNSIADGSQRPQAAVVIPAPELSVFVNRYEARYSAKSLTAEMFKELWLLYFAENLARHAWQNLATKSPRKILRRFLLRQNPDVLRAAAVTPVGRALISLAAHLQTKVTLSLFGKALTFETSGKSVDGRRLDLNEVIKAVMGMLDEAGGRVDIVLDRLDEVYKYDRGHQERMIQGFFLAEGNMAKLERIRVVALLRTDLYEVYDIREKNKHVGRSVRLNWDLAALYRMMVARVGSNKQLGTLADILRDGGEATDRAILARLKLLLPATIEGRPITEYLEFHLKNARGGIAPRQIVILLLSLRDAMIQTPKRASPLPVFEEHHVREALDVMSKLSFDELLDDFRIGQTLLRNCRAGSIVKMSLKQAQKMASAEDGDVNEQLTRLERLGVLERVLDVGKKGNLEPSFQFPPLYTRSWPAPVQDSRRP